MMGTHMKAEHETETGVTWRLRVRVRYTPDKVFITPAYLLFQLPQSPILILGPEP